MKNNTMNKSLQIMSIINITPNSFSGDGIIEHKNIIQNIKNHINFGANIIDIGAESTAPHNEPISGKEEWERLVNVLPKIFTYISEYNSNNKSNNKKQIKISLDSYKLEIWEHFLASAENNNFDINKIIINDVSGLGNNITEQENKLNFIKKYSVIYPNFQVCIMFDKTKTSEILTSENVISEIIIFFTKIITQFAQKNIDIKHVIIDTGMGGFLSKNAGVSFSLIENLQEIKDFASAHNIEDILIGTSQKTFLAPEKEPKNRISESVLSSIKCLKNGANIIRIHDTKELRKKYAEYEKLKKNK